MVLLVQRMLIYFLHVFQFQTAAMEFSKMGKPVIMPIMLAVPTVKLIPTMHVKPVHSADQFAMNVETISLNIKKNVIMETKQAVLIARLMPGIIAPLKQISHPYVLSLFVEMVSDNP